MGNIVLDMESENTGLILLRASRLEALVEPLHALLAQTRPANPLAAQTVIAAHPGMKQWLAGALARHVGAGRIIANLNVQLPSVWLDSLSRSLLGERAVALPRYRRGHLRWTLHHMLGDPAAHGITDPRVRHYLDVAGTGDERALRRFQLADQLAKVFSQYLVYRSDWLDAWEAGKPLFASARHPDASLRMLESSCLAPLWRSVVASLGDHRGRLVHALVAAIDRHGSPLAPLHVVGLSHLPPSELSVLRAYARHAPVFLYVPDPCREYWLGLHKAEDGRPPMAAWQRYREEEAVRLGDAEALDWHEQGHPLLARWGRLGQHFFAALVDGELREDIRHWQDEGVHEPGNRLERLQESIRRLQPALLREEVAVAASLTDASLRIHACHTRQRELEVLRDALLDAIDRDGMRPGDIVVMAPDIQSYLPLIPAVFGEAGSARERWLPYHLADVPVARSHPLFTVFETLLGLGASRLTAPDVADLLGVAEVRAALGSDEGDIDTLLEWLRNSRVAWALDGAHKQALGLPGRPEHSFAWAMDRLLAGYLMADVPGEDDPSPVRLPDGTELLPLAGIEGPSAAVLGALDRLLCELQAWRDLGQIEQRASQWSAVLRRRVDALLRIDRDDADARAALSVVHRAIAQLASEPACNGEDPLLRLSVVATLLRDALAAAPERQRFLMGGITFCGMVPQRAIPFGMVCVLGLDEGVFPRRPADGGIDLMAHIRRLGDRDVPSDDRYLFLETLMSARKRLHLSYVGQGVRDGRHRNPAAPLAELLAEIDMRCGIAPDDTHGNRPWLVRHPLQPFDQRYFDGSHPALFSFSTSFAGMQGDGRSPMPPLRGCQAPAREALPDPLPLGMLTHYFHHPAKALLKDHLQLSLDALDDDGRLPDVEPMDEISRLHSVARRVFLQQVLPKRCGDPAGTGDRKAPAWVRLGGLLPLGEAGTVVWNREAEAVDALWREAAASGRFDTRSREGGQTVRVDVPLWLPVDGMDAGSAPGRISGLLRNVFPLAGSAAGLQVVFAYPDTKRQTNADWLKDPDGLCFKDRVPAFLQWALLRLQHGDANPPIPVRLTMLAASEPDLARQANAWDERYCDAGMAHRVAMASDLRRRLRGLVDCLRMGRDGLSRFHPKAAWAALRAQAKVADDEGTGESVSESDDIESPSVAQGIAKAVRDAWVKDFGEGVGERDYAPGYTRLLEGDLVFGDPETDPGSHALDDLLREAQHINHLILMGAGGSNGTDTRGDAP